MRPVEMALSQSKPLSSARSIELVVGIPTIGRKDVLSSVIPYIACQSRRPDEVVICVASMKDLDQACLEDLPFPVRVLVSTPGSCRQRNEIIENTPTADVVVFLDDDFLMEASYLQRTEELFVSNPDIVVATGVVVADGILGPGISVAEGMRMLNGTLSERRRRACSVKTIYNAYGCNMIVRMSAIRQGSIRFDENLPLYGWLEDVDFSRMAARDGRIVSADSLIGVHLGIKVARTPGMRLGYSQIANPIYLMRKDTMSFKHAASQAGRNMLANLLRIWRPEPWVDRKGRFVGNMRALADLFTGRLSPRNAEKL
jgi:polysaccharide biosynthesis transport protein